MLASCVVRYELYPFYNITGSPLSSSGNLIYWNWTKFFFFPFPFFVPDSPLSREVFTLLYNTDSRGNFVKLLYFISFF